ncbi:MAG: F0F1 ATP synthase subunit epsilon [Arenibacterium sp.]
MADTMQFDLVSPERSLASLQVREVQIPGADGDMTAMPEHSPVITTLRPGILRIDGPDGPAEYLVSGGFAEINGESLSVLAEKAMPVSEVTRADIDEMVAEARAKQDAVASAAQGDSGAVDDAAKLVADMVALGDQIKV